MEPRDLTSGIAHQPHCEHEAFEAQRGNLVLGLVNVGPIAFLHVRRLRVSYVPQFPVTPIGDLRSRNFT